MKSMQVVLKKTDKHKRGKKRKSPLQYTIWRNIMKAISCLLMWSVGIVSLKQDFRSSKVSFSQKPVGFHPRLIPHHHRMLKVAAVSLQTVWSCFHWDASVFVANVRRRHLAMCSSVRRTKVPMSPWPDAESQVLVPGCPAVSACQCRKPVVLTGYLNSYFSSPKKGSALVHHI